MNGVTIHDERPLAPLNEALQAAVEHVGGGPVAAFIHPRRAAFVVFGDGLWATVEPAKNSDVFEIRLSRYWEPGSELAKRLFADGYEEMGRGPG